MPRPATDTGFREAIRRNVGRLAAPVTHLAGPVVPGRFGLDFVNGNLVSGSTPLLPGAPPAPPPEPAYLATGRTITVNMLIGSATREVAVTGPLPYPTVLRMVTITGTPADNEALSFRVLLADDADDSAVANPTGDDIITFGGDAVGAEDPGAHANLAVGHLVFEPWRRILTSGKRLKLKVHNLAGANRSMTAYYDLDDLVQ